MGRGKHQVSKSAQRLREAEEHAAALERTLRSERAAAAEREQALNNELARVRNQLIREVDNRAARKIDENDAKHAEEVATLKRNHQASLRRAVAYIVENGTLLLAMEDHARVASILGMTPGEWASLAGGHLGRTARRAGLSHANAVADLIKQGRIRA
jgi:hypothetical protein